MSLKYNPEVTRFKFKLAAHLGMTLGELETRMSYKELFKWMEYHKIEPFVADRIERMLAQLTAANMSAASGKQSFAFEYMISLTEEERAAATAEKVEHQIKTTTEE